jgi:hypothetical protein
MKFGQSRSFSSTFDRYCSEGPAFSGFFDHPIDKRIACPYKFSKHSGTRLGEEDLGGSVRAAARVALAGRCHRPGRAITAADDIPLNDCLSRPMISGSSGIKFTRDFRPTRTIFANDAIRAQSAGRKNGGCKARASNTTDLFS